MPSSRILCLTPFERPDARLASAVLRAGGVALLDLGADARQTRRALAELAAASPDRRFGVRVGIPTVRPEDLPDAVDLVLLPAGLDPARWLDHTVLVQVSSLDQALAAVEAGADGLVVKGWESGGDVGEETGLVLLQRIVDAVEPPVWVQAGVGPHGAAACVAGGAAGVLLDDQLALLREARTPTALAEAVARMDGSETELVDGRRGWRPPGQPDATLVPLGAGAALAAPLAARYRGVATLLRAYEQTIDDNLRLAAQLQPLAPASPLAAHWGLDYPIAQGPMTRVSDRAPFAVAVSDGGGLPFIALALMRAEQARVLLTDAAERLAGRTWGVGILGFAPPELRQAQLDLLLDIKPPVVLIAGGRPSQARVLEEQGIETWLHVPSPGLLDLYLQEGARHFIFEGRESGGHVGPRGSLSLWEAQVRRLLDFEQLEDVSLLFAGGVHDARSAAMVAALAAPLAARGARLGVLMGTAYLFTREAVETGAILPGFQQQALACRQTAVLQTAPGHATRCVDTAFVQAFREQRAQLESQGVDPKEIWARLEKLNLGRLRIASKGLERQGSELVAVDEARQLRDGLYMIGQAASLRHGVESIAALHQRVSGGGQQWLDAIAPDDAPVVEADDPARPVDIAIIGMACVFPESPDLDSFWTRILDGADSIRDVPEDRWSADIYFDPDARGSDGATTYCKAGGWLPAIRFDPLAYGIPPRSLVAIEPVQLLALEVARRALVDAGYAALGPGRSDAGSTAPARAFDRERAAVIFGAEAGTELAGAYGFRTIFRQYVGELPPELDAVLPRHTEDTFPGVLANVISGRIANRLDLGGPNYTVDAACASSLAALDAGIKELLSGSSDLALVGGADLHNGINDYVLFSSVHALSRRGEPRVFDESADGTVIGEGVGAVLLKRLADAERDGDRVYAVIKGVGSASDGKSLGLTAPRLEGQVRSLERAYRVAGLAPEDVRLIEAHGTGTVVGDKTELQALTQVFGDGAPGRCSLGSVKSQIGHTKCAAGMAGLIKAALSLHHGVRPPTLGVREPNPFWEPGRSPFSFAGHALPWPQTRRAAGVSAFGFGGTNFHVVLQQADDALPSDVARRTWPAELFLFRGTDRAAALARLDQLRDLVARDGELPLRDLARATSTGGSGPVWIAVVAGERGQLQRRLDRAAQGQLDPRGVFLRPDQPVLSGGGKLAFLFPGQGSQRPGMLADLFVAFPRLQRILRLGERWLDRVFPADAFTEEQRVAQQAALTDTRVAQPALGMVDLAMAELLADLGLRPDMLAGHSYGELAALAVAGALDEAELLDLSEARAACILDAAGGDPGTMAAVAATASQLERLLADHPDVVLANHNAPDQVVLSGPTAAIKAASAHLDRHGLKARPLPVACAFHSPVVAAAADAFAQRLATARVHAPGLQVWANSTAAPYDDDPDSLRSTLAGQVAQPVRFAEQIEAMYEAGARIFVEVGPGGVLSRLTGRILGDRPHLAVATDDDRTPGLVRLQLALAAAAVQGVDLDVDTLFQGRGARRFDLARPPAPAARPTDWLVNGHVARPAQGALPDGAMVPVTAPVVDLGQLSAAPLEDERERVVSDYLDNMRTLVEAQREVMLSFLGGPAAPRPQAVVEAEELPVAPADPSVSFEEEDLSIADLLLGIVSERTGYPLEMLDLDLDLEADLSIDSIKRIEILGLLGDRIGLSSAGTAERDAVVEQLASVRSLRGIIDWLEEQQGGDGFEEEATAPHPVVQGAAYELDSDQLEDDPAPALQRFVVTVEPVAPPRPRPDALRGRRILLSDDGAGVATALASELSGKGALAEVVDPATLPENGEDLVDLSGLATADEPARHLFGWARAVAGGPERRLLAVTGLGGGLGAPQDLPRALAGGPAGLLKTVARERPELGVRVVDVDPAQPAESLASILASELADTRAGAPSDVEVGWSRGVRVRQSLEPRPLDLDGPPRLALDSDAVVLVTGGARGIAARSALALARRQPCRLELVGRSPLPEPETDAEIIAASDRAALRRLLSSRGDYGGLREIESACDRILGAREIRTNLSTLEQAGARVRYHAVDVRDETAFGALIDRMYDDYGRLDGVVHAAGVLEDRLLVQKTAESFDRVFDTKVVGARVIARHLRPGAAFVVFFGSISGVLGNRGQVDYAAANDALDKLARSLNGRLAQRVLAIDWGPWRPGEGAGGGMVGPELEREYLRRGVGLIEPDEGAAAFVDELLHGEPEHAQILWMCGSPESLV